MEILGREWETEMENCRIKGQQIKIVKNDVNSGYYENKQNYETKYRDNFKIQGERNDKQQRRNQDYNYEKQNNLRRELKNSQNGPQFQQRYADGYIRYFYNNR